MKNIKATLTGDGVERRWAIVPKPIEVKVSVTAVRQGDIKTFIFACDAFGSAVPNVHFTTFTFNREFPFSILKMSFFSASRVLKALIEIDP